MLTVPPHAPPLPFSSIPSPFSHPISVFLFFLCNTIFYFPFLGRFSTPPWSLTGNLTSVVIWIVAQILKVYMLTSTYKRKHKILSFGVWDASHRMIFFLPPTVYPQIPFFLTAEWYSVVWMYPIFLIHSSINGCLGYFQDREGENFEHLVPNSISCSISRFRDLYRSGQKGCSIQR